MEIWVDHQQHTHEKTDSERTRNLPSVTEVITSRTRFQAQISRLWIPSLLCPNPPVTSFGCCFTGWLASQNVKLKGQGAARKTLCGCYIACTTLRGWKRSGQRQEFENLGLLVLDSITDGTAAGDAGWRNSTLPCPAQSWGSHSSVGKISLVMAEKPGWGATVKSENLCSAARSGSRWCPHRAQKWQGRLEAGGKEEGLCWVPLMSQTLYSCFKLT